MAQYKLLSQHVTPEGVVLEEGTIVGDDTPYPWLYPHTHEPMPPSNAMEGMDDEAKEKIKELNRKLYGDESPHTLGPPEDILAARKAEEEASKKAEEGSEPVSPMQRYERKVAEEQEKAEGEGMPKPAFTPPGPAGTGPSVHTAPPSFHRTGQRVVSPGVATPKPPRDEDARPRKPNEEQYPKG
jgi:hypothetical protein